MPAKATAIILVNNVILKYGDIVNLHLIIKTTVFPSVDTQFRTWDLVKQILKKHKLDRKINVFSSVRKLGCISRMHD